MTTLPAFPGSTVHSILLASDLSCRSDRALDRALLLARQWQCALVIVTVIDSAETRHLAPHERALHQRTAERRVLSDAGAADVPITVHVAFGDRVASVLEVAAQEGCGLIVLGAASHQGMGRMMLGSTIDALIARAPVPVLAVRQRARQPYPALVVASDFSPAALHALEHAGRLFPAAALHVFHALEAGPALGKSGGGAHERNERLRQAQALGDAHLAEAALSPALRGQVQFIFREGDAGLLLEAHGQARCDDLVVLGARPRHRLVNLLIGSVAQRILERTENDVLLIADPTGVPPAESTPDARGPARR